MAPVGADLLHESVSLANFKNELKDSAKKIHNFSTAP